MRSKLAMQGLSQGTSLVFSLTNSQIPNCIARSKGDRRVYIGEQLANCKDYGALGFRRPFDRVQLLQCIIDVGIFDVLGDTEGCLGQHFV